MKKKIILTGLLISIALAVLLSPFASRHPDGLEKVAEDKKFISAEKDKAITPAPLSGYIFPGIKDRRVAVSLAGLTGTLFVFAVSISIGYLLKQKKQKG
ncbi:MAG: PDGLE domain-containing protein [Spirochaetes bacterium]|nr:PDGLE domain-containing protein [Spirochaetota bacterium]